jgi:transposase
MAFRALVPPEEVGSSTDCKPTSCRGCGHTLRGEDPQPSIHQAALAGPYRLSKRQIQQLAGELFGLSISTGMISELDRMSARALQAPYNELATAVHTAGVIGADETAGARSGTRPGCGCR